MWTSKSFAFVNKGGYLDKLAKVYPAPKPELLQVTGAQREALRKVLDQPNDKQLLELLLSFERFPFNDPYVSFLRESHAAIDTNPEAVKRICGRVREMGLSAVVRGLEQPKQFNRQMGAMFDNWLCEKYAHTSDVEVLQKSTDPIIALDAGGEQLRRFANIMGCGLQKRPDFVVKANGRYVVGEAKFIGTEGGNQNRGFDDALNLASRSFKQAVTVAILDGIVWLPNSGQMSQRLVNFGGNALSALLLDDFFASL